MIDFQEIRQLFDVWDNSSGIPEQEIIDCEKRLGLRLPETLRQYYLQLGNNEQINQTHDSLILPLNLTINNSDNFVFYEENQGVWKSGIRLSDFILENPSSHINVDNSGWKPINLSLSSFLTSMAYLQSLFAFPYNANGHEFDSQKLDFIKQNWKKVDFSLHNWEVSFYQNSYDEVLALMGKVNVFIAAKNINKFEELSATLKIDWDYNSLEDE